MGVTETTGDVLKYIYNRVNNKKTDNKVPNTPRQIDEGAGPKQSEGPAVIVTISSKKGKGASDPAENQKWYTAVFAYIGSGIVKVGSFCADVIESVRNIKNNSEIISNAAEQLKAKAEVNAEKLEGNEEALALNAEIANKITELEQEAPELVARAKELQGLFAPESGITEEQRAEYRAELLDIQTRMVEIKEELRELNMALNELKRLAEGDPTVNLEDIEQRLADIQGAVVDVMVVCVNVFSQDVTVENAEENAQAIEKAYRTVEEVRVITQNSSVKEKCEKAEKEIAKMIIVFFGRVDEIGAEISAGTRAALYAIASSYFTSIAENHTEAEKNMLLGLGFLNNPFYKTADLVSRYLEIIKMFEEEEAEETRYEEMQRQQKIEEKRKEIKRMQAQIEMQIDILLVSLQALANALENNDQIALAKAFSQIDEQFNKIESLMEDLQQVMTQLESLGGTV